MSKLRVVDITNKTKPLTPRQQFDLQVTYVHELQKKKAKVGRLRVWMDKECCWLGCSLWRIARKPLLGRILVELCVAVWSISSHHNSARYMCKLWTRVRSVCYYKLQYSLLTGNGAVLWWSSSSGYPQTTSLGSEARLPWLRWFIDQETKALSCSSSVWSAPFCCCQLTVLWSVDYNHSSVCFWASNVIVQNNNESSTMTTNDNIKQRPHTHTHTINHCNYVLCIHKCNT